jgi:hypothetical protein
MFGNIIEEGFVLLLQQTTDAAKRAAKSGDIVVKDLNNSILRENIVGYISNQEGS